MLRDDLGLGKELEVLIKNSSYRQAKLYYSDFHNIGLEKSIKYLEFIIESDKFSLDRSKIIRLLNGMIYIFEQYEDYESCVLCRDILLKIKENS